MDEITTGEAFYGLKRAINEDPEYAFAWFCNLAVPIRDVTRCQHDYGSQAAALIMAQMFDCDITTHPHYTGGKSGVQAYFEARRDADREDSK